MSWGRLDGDRLYFQVLESRHGNTEGPWHDQFVIVKVSPEGDFQVAEPPLKWQAKKRDTNISHRGWAASSDDRRALDGRQGGKVGFFVFHGGKTWQPFAGSTKARNIRDVHFPPTPGHVLVETSTPDNQHRFVQLVDATSQTVRPEFELKTDESLTLTPDGKHIYATRPNGFRVLTPDLVGAP